MPDNTLQAQQLALYTEILKKVGFPFFGNAPSNDGNEVAWGSYIVEADPPSTIAKMDDSFYVTISAHAREDWNRDLKQLSFVWEWQITPIQFTQPIGKQAAKIIGRTITSFAPDRNLIVTDNQISGDAKGTQKVAIPSAGAAAASITQRLKTAQTRLTAMWQTLGQELAVTGGQARPRPITGGGALTPSDQRTIDNIQKAIVNLRNKFQQRGVTPDFRAIGSLRAAIDRLRDMPTATPLAETFLGRAIQAVNSLYILSGKPNPTQYADLFHERVLDALGNLYSATVEMKSPVKAVMTKGFQDGYRDGLKAVQS